MAVVADDLLAPNGPVETELFPGEDHDALTERLNAFISQAEAQAAQYTWANQAATDAGVTAYALYLSFRQAHTLALVRPAEEDSQAEMLGRVTYEEDQRDGIKDLADWYWKEWVNLSESTLTDPTSAVSTGVPSHQTSLQYDW